MRKFSFGKLGTLGTTYKASCMVSIDVGGAEVLILVHFPCFRAFCQLQTISAVPSRNLNFRERSAVPSRATRGWLAVSRKPRCLRGIRAARGIPREPRGETGKAEACTSFAEFSAVLGEPRDDREGTELSHALHVSAGCSRSLVDRARSAQRQSRTAYCCALGCILYPFIVIDMQYWY